MINTYRKEQFQKFNKAKEFFIHNFQLMIELEKYFNEFIFQLIKDNILEIKSDYDEASKLYPFWQNYPPDKRGRMPLGDQFPWIEVGEHAIGDKLLRLISNRFKVRDVGLPTGPDKRIVIIDKEVEKITKKYTNTVWLFIDIKSAGPRDDFNHAVMSHNQVSGDGSWINIKEGVKNSILIAKGKYRKHNFYCSISPIYIFSDGTIVPVIDIVLKPTYSMLSLLEKNSHSGQPLKRVTIASIPNGILLNKNPGYLKQYPSLFFPGKDDKSKNPLKVRARVDFERLKLIDNWRVRKIEI